MRVLICGSRNWKDYDSIVVALQRLLKKERISLIVEGECQGADILGRMAAEMLSIPVKKFPANWHLYGIAAGPVRNQQMLDEGHPDLVLAFHDDLRKSKGTADMVRRARKANIPVKIIRRRFRG